jgi:hypothetical protein
MRDGYINGTKTRKTKLHDGRKMEIKNQIVLPITVIAWLAF